MSGMAFLLPGQSQTFLCNIKIGAAAHKKRFFQTQNVLKEPSLLSY